MNGTLMTLATRASRYWMALPWGGMPGAEKNFVNCLSDWDWTTCPEELATRLGWPLTVLVVLAAAVVSSC
jgi:hypothetical protein